MKIILNGREQHTQAKTIAELVQSLGYEGDYFAVARNLVCIQRAHYGEMLLQDNDDIEILTPMQGG